MKIIVSDEFLSTEPQDVRMNLSHFQIGPQFAGATLRFRKRRYLLG